MSRVLKLSAIAKGASIGVASLALASVFSAAGLTQSTPGVTPSRDQPVTNPGVSGQNAPASTIPSTISPAVPLGDQPVTNPGVSGQNAPASTIPSTISPAVPLGDQPVINPGVSGQNAPASTIPSTISPAVPLGDQPVINPGVSGQNAPASTIPSTSSPAVPLGDQPVINPGVSGQNNPASTIPSTSFPTTPSTPGGTANPSNVIQRTIIQRNDLLTPGNQAPTQPRTNRTAPAQTPTRSTSPAAPTAQPLPQSTGFIRTAIASQFNGSSTPGLDAQLLQATCNQNWRGAIAIVDRALTAAPANQGVYRSQLRQYRSRLESLSAAGTAIPNWSQRCSGG
jgi:hypothetical protein